MAVVSKDFPSIAAAVKKASPPLPTLSCGHAHTCALRHAPARAQAGERAALLETKLRAAERELAQTNELVGSTKQEVKPASLRAYSHGDALRTHMGTPSSRMGYSEYSHGVLSTKHEVKPAGRRAVHLRRRPGGSGAGPAGPARARRQSAAGSQSSVSQRSSVQMAATMAELHRRIAELEALLRAAKAECAPVFDICR
jgi:hypothetical protein